jgi:succinate dehydrogenase / fumarate reductase cytochrome b subunit
LAGKPLRQKGRLVNERAVAPPGSFLERHEFLLRRLHSLSGIVPVGAYMVVHLLTNASILDSPASFQRRVYAIHSLGMVLPLVEWTLIFIPILYHALYGLLITRTALPNHSSYPYVSNVRYTLQRATGMVAFFFIMWHVFHMHGWLHASWWEEGVARPLAGAMFKPYNAASTAAQAIQLSGLVPILYAIGVVACVFHLANGIWTFGITWGLWITPQAQRWATVACVVFGLGLGAVGLSAVAGFTFRVDVQEARKIEDLMYEQQFAAELKAARELNLPEPGAHKRAAPLGEHPKPAPATASAEGAHP